MIYKDLYPDIEIQQYLLQNPRSVFFADYAFDSRYLSMVDILRLGLSQRVILVDGNERNRSFLKTAQRVNLSPMDLKEQVYSVSLDAAKAEITNVPSGWQYTFDLPDDFPFYLSTTVFTFDHASWRLSVNGRFLEPMQGQLTSPDTFDVQNIQEKKMTILLPDKLGPRADIKLQVKLPDRISAVWKDTYDDIGFTYQAPKDGWLVFNYPYDDKWELTIDGQKTPISHVDRYFIGAPISSGGAPNFTAVLAAYLVAFLGFNFHGPKRHFVPWNYLLWH